MMQKPTAVGRAIIGGGVGERVGNFLGGLF
jgi:hypothetical protein